MCSLTLTSLLKYRRGLWLFNHTVSMGQHGWCSGWRCHLTERRFERAKGFLQVLQIPPWVQRHAGQVNLRLWIACRCGCGMVVCPSVCVSALWLTVDLSRSEPNPPWPKRISGYSCKHVLWGIMTGSAVSTVAWAGTVVSTKKTHTHTQTHTHR